MEPDPPLDEGVFDDTEPDAEDELDAREAARMRRRDHDADLHARELMRPGMGKVFKQITDSWGENAAPGQKRARKTIARDS